ncbi:unnamed protein product [Urochloa decumbens]|uniref:DUF4408 domain-containing protein n=1 Tax=Urochloa decumbens TaxID=240449 RepID=A0ABC9BCB0_9POAL
MAMEYMPSWPLSSWISPGAALFLLCNALVGAIVVTSSRGEQGGRAAASTRRLCRSASSMVLDRLRSFSIFSGHPASVEESYDHPSLEMEAEEEEEEEQPQPAAAEPVMPTAPASATATAASESAEEVAEAAEDEAVISEEAQEPARQGHALQLPAVGADAAETEATAAAERPATVVGSIVQRARACRRELVGEALEGKAALNARAELFIRQFREDLKLQRVNSIINYTRALRRGASGAPAAEQ